MFPIHSNEGEGRGSFPQNERLIHVRKAGSTMLRTVIIAFIALALTSVAGVLVTYTPTIEYDPRAESRPIDRRIGDPARFVEEFLHRDRRLPVEDLSLVRRNGALEWERRPESTASIANVEIQRVRLTTITPLLRAMLDDDPILSAEVEARVTTADGKTIALVVQLWDVGLLTPWTVSSFGDGWKPSRVRLADVG